MYALHFQNNPTFGYLSIQPVTVQGPVPNATDERVIG